MLDLWSVGSFCERRYYTMAGRDLPTLYDIYMEGGYNSGLVAEGEVLKLNGKPIQIISGTLHYFRVVPEYWEDRLTKMKACGLNTVDVYVPWNFHEETPGIFDFTYGMKNIRKFLSAVRHADMFVIFRPGPYICAEWDFGGLPSWLLQDEKMRIRSNYEPYKKAVHRYLMRLASEVREFQFHINFGPIVAIQIENEFSEFGNTLQNPDDAEYMLFLKNTLMELDLKELFFTSDMPSQNMLPGSIPGILMAGNFQSDAENELSILKSHQQDRPLFVAEFWSGWYDHWRESHSVYPLQDYENSLKAILKAKASVNIYVFHGGTNFGFLNGANDSFPKPETPYLPTCTSYDYNAPLTECGDYTPKYYATKDIIEKFCSDAYPKCKLPPMPSLNEKMLMTEIPVSGISPLSDILSYCEYTNIDELLPMELVRTNQNCGQCFGYVLYRTNINCGGRLALDGVMADRAQVFLNGKELATWEWTQKCFEVSIPDFKGHTLTLDILVENMGRVNYGIAGILNSQRKGLWGKMKLQDTVLSRWTVYALDFPHEFIDKVNPTAVNVEGQNPPFLHKIEFSISHEPRDTFLYSKTWRKGVAFINCFNLGRYWAVGPQQTLYVPAKLLNKGRNCIFIFDLNQKITTIDLLDKPILDILKTF